MIKTSSATALAFAPGVLRTQIPCSVALATVILFTPAPALATAQVGIAMGVSGSELAVNAADIALLTDDLSKIPLVIHLGRRTFRIIKENLWFALIFNGVMLYLASAGFLSMIGGALVHQLSSLGVILNSMRLISVGEFTLPRR